ncbi:MAG: hypothetical protein EHM61_27005 [Acidobacteria bacterium]|nr:MAG: hypothetical protein EHM61_27005 [Acidobacteriota bacterium]
MSKRKKIISLLAALFISTQLWAGVIPGRWDKVARVREGTVLNVLLKDGSQVDGRAVQAGSTALTVMTPDGARHELRQDEVRRIVRPVPEDTVKNGVTWGLVAGAATGLVVTLAVWAPWMQNEGSGAGGIGFATVGVCGGIGALVGFAADSAIRTSDEILFEALP